MLATFQDILALLIIAVAAMYVARRAWLTLRGGKSGGCSTCRGCPSGQESSADNSPTPRELPIIPVESLRVLSPNERRR
ncbi:MAG: FeoB-associated Cys-rich membrane protein [Planctomycetales bacterium]|nr:FeoB-associated Cys-rich membrane protein [Planctomycetales bacterium]MCA9227119.1 FeoB-associated Cys-rich membrane protein [Planctomycetales bacterium]